jgi:hypothetical protein
MPPKRPEPIPRGPTPRAQLTRVVVAATAALVLGAGPAIAWDLSTQPPRADPPTGWPKPSPWLAAGKQMKTAAGGIARIYFPRASPAPADPEDAAPPPMMPTPATTPTGSPSTGPVVVTRPMPYKHFRY